MRTRKKRAGFLIGIIFFASINAFAVSSTPVLVDATSQSRHWATVCTNEVTLRWNWNTNATHATLEIAGMNGTLTTNLNGVVSNWVWRVSESVVPSAEDVYALTLTFLASGDSVVGSLTSRLAVVKGAFGAAAVNAVSNSPAWSKVRENVVIPYDAVWLPSATNATTSLLEIAKVGGASQNNAFADAAGYFGWKLKHSDWGYGTFNLALTFSGTEDTLTATLKRPMDGTSVSIR